jgi:uncharacterized protein YndB with AHSA1/START domain
MIMEPLIIKNTIQIHAPAAVVWDVLTNPEKTKIYMFGCETVSEWTVGSELLWRAEYEGKIVIFVKGYIKEIIAHTKLVYSVFDPNSTMEDIPQNYLDVTYQLTEENNATTFIVTQGDYNIVAEGERRYNEGYNNGEGWNPILIEIKKIAEQN